jgi:hypothetical protein
MGRGIGLQPHQQQQQQQHAHILAFTINCLLCKVTLNGVVQPGAAAALAPCKVCVMPLQQQLKVSLQCGWFRQARHCCRLEVCQRSHVREAGFWCWCWHVCWGGADWTSVKLVLAILEGWPSHSDRPNIIVLRCCYEHLQSMVRQL